MDLSKSLLINSELEKPILRYKLFYVTYFLNLKNRQELLAKLHPLCLKFQERKPRSIIVRDTEADKIEFEAEDLIKRYLGQDLLNLFNKEISVQKAKKKFIYKTGDSFLLSLLADFGESFEEHREKYKQEWNYKTNFLIFINNCIANYGLHKNILKRNPSIYKRFNLIIYHHYRTKKSLVEFKFFLTYNEFQDQFTKLYILQKPIKFGGKLIPFKSIHEVKITTTFLQKDEIQLFAIKNGFKWTEKEKDHLSFINCCLDETEKYHPNPFDESTYTKKIDSILIEHTRNLLSKYPESQKLYNSALDKFSKGIYNRNILDDLRLSLELLLKNIFKNNKSLENQLTEIGGFQKQKGASIELTNMFQKLLDYYSKYQNNYVKHNDKINLNEIEFIIDLTSSFLKYLKRFDT